jgi:hypothetical protein
MIAHSKETDCNQFRKMQITSRWESVRCPYLIEKQGVQKVRSKACARSTMRKKLETTSRKKNEMQQENRNKK